MQRLLAARGHAVGAPDGIIGANTRAAIRTFQKASGLPPDGFASSSLLERLRREPPRLHEASGSGMTYAELDYEIVAEFDG